MAAVARVNGKAIDTSFDNIQAGDAPPQVRARMTVVTTETATGPATGTRTKIITEVPPDRTSQISIEEIYRVPEAGSVELRTAIMLLRDTVAWCDQAMHALDSDDVMMADDTMVHVQVAIPELFCCRAIGDGFGAVVNAIQSAFENCRGMPLKKLQIQAMRSALAAIREKPRMLFDRALDYISAIEQTGLAVEPMAVDALAEWLCE